MGKYNDKYKSFYGSRQWIKLRKQVMADNMYLCVECKNGGVIRKATEVHHVVPIEVDYGKRLDYENLRPLCHEHHDRCHDRCSNLETFLKEWEL